MRKTAIADFENHDTILSISGMQTIELRFENRSSLCAASQRGGRFPLGDGMTNQFSFTAEVKTYGIGSGVEMISQNDTIKHVWYCEYNQMRHELRLRRYTFYQRETKRHGWKGKDVIGGWNRRADTLKEMPPPPPELCDLAIKEWGKITINFGDWKIR